MGTPPRPAPEGNVAPPRERRWLPAFLVAVALSVVVFGGYLAAGALSAPAGRPVSVAGAVRVSPLSGWFVAVRSASPPGVELTRGSGNLDVLAIRFGGNAFGLTHEYVNQVLEPNADRLSLSRQVDRVTLSSGLSGVRISYVGLFGRRGQTATEGEVTAVVSPAGIGVVFDGWAPQGLLQYVSGDIQTMIETARVR